MAWCYRSVTGSRGYPHSEEERKWAECVKRSLERGPKPPDWITAEIEMELECQLIEQEQALDTHPAPE